MPDCHTTARRLPVYRIFIVAVCTVCLLNGPAASAPPATLPPDHASSPPAWSLSSVSLNTTANVNDTRFHRYWQPQPGIAVRWAMPFYFGEIEAEAGFHTFSARDEAQPGFHMASLSVGWGLRHHFKERISAMAAFHFGTDTMRFGSGSGSGSPFSGLETEFSITPAAELRYHIHPDWFLTMRAGHKRVFTYHRMDLTYLSVGAGFRFATPGRLRNILSTAPTVRQPEPPPDEPSDTKAADPSRPPAEYPTDPAPPRLKSGETIITRDMIEAAALTRLSDLPGLTGDWYLMSVNGFDSQVAPAGLSGWKHPAWKVMIDSQEFDLNFLDAQSLNLLPVNLVDIEEVTFLSRPGYVNGVWSPGGFMKITTRRRHEDGADLRVRIMAGNEINDPGPFEFTGLRTPNEERIGPEYEISAGYRSGRHFVRGGIRYQEHKSTDTPIDRRIKLMRVTGPDQYRDAVNHGITSYVQAGSDRGRIRHQLFASLTRIHDFHFFYLTGHEVPVFWNFYHAGWSGTAEITDRHRMQWQSSLNSRTARYKPNRFGLDFDVPVQTIRNRVMVRSDSGPSGYTAGVSHMYFRDRGNGSLDESFHLTDLFASGWMALSPAYRIEIQAGVQTDFTDTGYRAAMEHQIRIHPDLHLSGRLSWHDMLRREQPDIWMRRNVTNRVLDSPAHFTGPGSRQMLHGSLGVSTRLGAETDVAADLSLTRHRNHFHSRHQYRMVPDFQWFGYELSFPGGHSPVVAGLTVMLSDRTFATFRHQLSYRFQEEISGGDPVGFDLFSRHRVTLGSTWSPIPGLDFRVDVRAQSAVTWPEFEEVDGQTYTDINELAFYTYSNTTGPFVNLDAAVGKNLWDNRLRISFRGTNLLNQGYFLYPAGLDYDLTFFAQIEISL